LITNDRQGFDGIGFAGLSIGKGGALRYNPRFVYPFSEMVRA